MTVVSTSGYTYLSPPVIVFNRHNWGWGSCTKKRHSSVFEQETIISELNHSSLVLWFSPLSYTHTCFKYEGPHLWWGIHHVPTVARGSLAGQSLGQQAESKATPGLWMETWAQWRYVGAQSWARAQADYSFHKPLLGLAAGCSCRGTGVRPTPGSTSCLNISEIVNDKLAVPIVLIKRDLILGLWYGFIFSGEDQQTSSCASSGVSVISLINHWVQV